MRKAAAILLLLASLYGCKASGIVNYWIDNSTDYSDFDAAQDRFANYAEQAVAASEADALASMDILFDKLKEDEIAYYVYTDLVNSAFYNPLSPCRNAALYCKAVERIASDGIFSENECEPFHNKANWIRNNLAGSPAIVPGVVLDGRRTLVLVLNLGCPSCANALGKLAESPEWADVRRVAIGLGYGPEPDVPGWEYCFPGDTQDVFDPEITPTYFVVSAEGLVEDSYMIL